MDEHGLLNNVHYVAGKADFKAFVKTSEPGTDVHADVNVNADAHFEALD